ncbi:MAG: electron transfer flavoprotein subunit alpha/FixB family protein [Saprospiraceae bacterium]|nr:electron transfer flavoprotein subunit alpha/FixB family protein [Saprospiraceae bacterium]
MSVLVFAESPEGKCKKVAFEAVSYARKTADLLQTNCIALTLGSPDNASDLGKYGAKEVKNIPNVPEHLDGAIYAKAIAGAVRKTGATVLILSHSSTGKSIAGRLAVKLEAGYVANVNGLPMIENGFEVNSVAFSGKATATYAMESDIKMLSLMSNSFQVEVSGEVLDVDTIEMDLPTSELEITDVKKQEGAVPLPEAELVVSGGRGFKGPENWQILLDLADALSAATACSRPVADSEWRPHHEHVGQTGVTIRPNLYIAIGISGAIQHLGGVNNSHCIVVVNKDPEAPFFKAADYGVVGDLFDVVPRLTESVKKYKASHG